MKRSNNRSTLVGSTEVMPIVHDVVDGQEIMRVFQLGDQRELLVQGGAERVIDLAAEIGVDTGPGQIFQMLLRGLARRHRLIRILVFELVEREADTIGEAQGFSHGVRKIAEQPHHFIRRLEMALGIRLKSGADRLDGGLLADAGQHVL
jgi:hypothetical protein